MLDLTVLDQKIGFLVKCYLHIQILRSTGLNLGQDIKNTYCFIVSSEIFDSRCLETTPTLLYGKQILDFGSDLFWVFDFVRCFLFFGPLI